LVNAQPHYTVTAVNPTGGTAPPVIPGGAMSFSFQITNVSAQNGTQQVSWTLYASTTGVLDGSQIQMATGAILPLDSGAFTTVSLPAAWPLHYGLYRLLAFISVAEDTTVPVDHLAVSGITSVGIFSETDALPGIGNGNLATLVGANDFGVAGGIPMKPGMSILINGALPNPSNNYDKDDIFEFKTGTASAIYFYLTLPSSLAAGLYPMSGPATYLPGVETTGGTSLGWAIPAAPAGSLWIDVQDGALGPPNTYGKTDIPSYSLVISAN
jgi:hypothetical protein